MGEELNRSLNVLAERGVPRGAAAVLEDAQADVAGAARSGQPSWQRGLVVAFGTAVALLIVVGAVILLARPFGGEGLPPATTDTPVVPTTVPVTPIRADESAGPLNDVGNLAFAPDGHLWATTSAGLVRWDAATGDYIIFGEWDGVPAGDVETIEVAPDGTVWMAASDWIARYDGAWQVFSGANTPELNGQLGDLAVGVDGVVWATVASEPLARFDGSWSVVDPPLVGGVPNGLAIGPDGTLWAGSHDAGVFAFDGSTWEQYTEDDGAPQRTTGIAVAPNGDVWAWGAGFYTAAQGGDYIPPTAFARFDGTAWTRFTTDDGLLANDGSVVVAPDGTVWVMHGELGPNHEPVPTRLSRFDGTTWTTYPAPGDHHNGGWSGATVGTDGTLWIPGPDGIIGFDGTATTELVIPPELATPPLMAISVTPSADQEPVRVSTVIGDLEFVTVQLGLGHPVFATVATPYGPAAMSGDELRWSTDFVTWEGVRTDSGRSWIATDGADIILAENGFARYAWDGTGWVKVAEVDLPGTVQDIAFGPRGAVALVDDLVYYSTDGVNFAPADAGPNSGLDGRRSARCEISGPFAPVGGDGNGPILVTETGYVILAPASSTYWDGLPLCAPLVWFSADGNTWELLTEQSPFGAAAAIRDVAAYEGRYVAVGGTTPDDGAVWVSTDGIEWERADVELLTAQAIAGGDLGWFLTGSAEWDQGLPGTHTWFSADGLTWDGPYEGPEGLAMFYFRTEPSVGSNAIFSVNGAHDGFVIGRLQE